MREEYIDELRSLCEYDFVDGIYEGNGLFKAQGTSFQVEDFGMVPDGTTYIGCFENDRANGKGEQKTPDGLIYVGEFQDNFYHGQGHWTFPDSTIYIGEFAHSLPNGIGEMKFKDGFYYKGEYKNGYY